MNKQPTKLTYHCGTSFTHYCKGSMNKLIGKCPNCEDPDENIKPTKDGKCGVCGGTRKIEWKETGISFVDDSKPVKLKKYQLGDVTFVEQSDENEYFRGVYGRGVTIFLSESLLKQLGARLIEPVECESEEKPKKIEKIEIFGNDSDSDSINRLAAKLNQLVDTVNSLLEGKV